MADRDGNNSDSSSAAVAGVVAAAVVPAMGSMELVLLWIGLDIDNKRRLVLDELGDELNDFYQTYRQGAGWSGKDTCHTTFRSTSFDWVSAFEETKGYHPLGKRSPPDWDESQS
jgi:hypothetical protein